MYDEINNPMLFGFMVLSGLFALYSLQRGLKALANRTSHFDILTPVLNSCFNCTGAHVLAPEKRPQGVAIKELEKTTLQCREQLRDETRMTDARFMDKWSFLYEEAPLDYTAIAGKCASFTPKLVNKDGSIG